MSETTMVAEPGQQRIEVSRTFHAPRDVVFRAFTDPELVVRWLGPRRLTTEVDVHEVRDGGRWRYVHRDDDGTEYGFHGVFHGDPSPDRIVRTFEWEGAPGHVSLEVATFEEHDGRTTVHMVDVHASTEARDAMIADGMESGMNEGFERLDELLAQLGAAA